MTKPKRTFRITYRVRAGHLPLVGEVNITTSKERWEIDHEAVVTAYLSASDNRIVLDEIIDVEEIK